MKDSKYDVGIVRAKEALYPTHPPFNPPQIYPEYCIGETIDASNMVYPAVRDMLRILKLDEKNYGKENWNPLSDIINPGDKVVIKPNFVVDSYYLEEREFYSAVTHGSVIRPLIDYACIATGKKGEIIIADGSIESTDFRNTIEATGTLGMVDYLKSKHNFPLKIIDLRKEYLKKYGAVKLRNFEIGLWLLKKLDGDPKGYIKIDLKEDSEFEEVSETLKYLRSTQLARSDKEPKKHHKKGKHEYSVSKTILMADVIINIPKLKVHKIAGNTLSLKNMIGITIPRNWMPHYACTKDEYSKSTPIKDKILKFMWSIPQVNGVGCLLINKLKGHFDVQIKGSHPDNDTLWRSILDINKILFYADKNGKMHESKQRKYFTLIDGIIGGENYAPLSPTPKNSKVLVGGFDPIAVDTVTTSIMGFDYTKIKSIKNSFKIKKYPFGIGDPSLISMIGNYEINLRFNSPYNWRGCIEKIEEFK